MLFADKLMNTAIRYARDKQQAQDLVHDTFIKVFHQIQQYKDQGKSVEAWMRRILINEALQGFRKNKSLSEIDDKEMLNVPASDFSIIDTLAAEDVLDLLNKVPEGCRMIFNLYVVEGYSHNEIGELLKITPSASRAQLSRAKRVLRSLVTQINKSFVAE